MYLLSLPLPTFCYYLGKVTSVKALFFLEKYLSIKSLLKKVKITKPSLKTSPKKLWIQDTSKETLFINKALLLREYLYPSKTYEI